ncbi:MAG: LysR family transcriptional regulator [Thomasclavelia sp.]|nr:LysR family transcriptional regulator [Thomasclavelia sp.]
MIKQMEYFIKVVETHSFTKAADECFISQSAISQQIKALEEQLDVKLLVRKNRSFKLTPAGEYFYYHCKEIVKEFNELCQKTKDIEDDESVLKIGYPRTYNGDGIEKAIIEFSNIYPNTSIRLIKGNHEELYNLFLNKEISLILNDQRRTFNEDCFNYHLSDLGLFIEVSKKNKLAQNKTIDLEELKNETCVLVSSKSQQTTEKTFYENYIGIKTNYFFVEDLEEGRMMININKGFMPVEGIKKVSNPNTMSIPLMKDGKQIKRGYYAFWSKDNTNYYIEEFVNILKNVINQ